MHVHVSEDVKPGPGGVCASSHLGCCPSKGSQTLGWEPKVGRGKDFISVNKNVLSIWIVKKNATFKMSLARKEKE